MLKFAESEMTIRREVRFRGTRPARHQRPSMALPEVTLGPSSHTVKTGITENDARTSRFSRFGSKGENTLKGYLFSPQLRQIERKMRQTLPGGAAPTAS